MNMVLTILQMMVYTDFVALGLVFFTIGLPETFPKSNIESHHSNHEWDASERR